MPTVQLDDVAIYHEVTGAGKPILLSHGLAGSIDHWRPAIGPLVALGYRVIAYDQRGHGRSGDGTKDYTIPQLAADLAHLMDHLKLEKATLAGHSMGGRTVLLFALDHPQRVDRLILNCAAGGPPAGEARAAFELFADLARRQGMQAVWDNETYQRRLPRTFRENAALCEFYKNGVLSARPHGYGGAINSIITMPDLMARLGELRCRTLALVGAEDPGAPFVDAVAAKVPTAVKAVIPGAGHFPHIETPELFNEALHTFLLPN
jgi:pimeloyl-ACP methyl ester carboxylesterase